MASSLPIVGIGASAGGIEALEAFFRAMPRDNGMAFVIITHLPRNRRSLLPEILGRITAMPTAEAQNNQTVEAEHVYVLPPGATMTIAGGRLGVHASDAGDHTHMPIDLFFTALAEDRGDHAIGIVLSGGGSDGTLGLKAIKERGGLTIAQGGNDSRPRFAQMPESAVAAGFVDLVLPVEDIPGRLVEYVKKWDQFVPEQPADALSRVYRLLRVRTGHDFSQYREQTFQRRIQRRMQVAQIERLEDYVARLEKEPDEVGALFRDLLIGVTGFFRDPAAFQALEATVIPKIFEHKGVADEVRIWVPGCATGEETYSLAILCAERLGKLPARPRVTIFGTDIDDTALTAARAGRYPAPLLRDVSPERLARFFTEEEGTYRIANALRDMCIFSTHSVIRDPPFSRLDLVSCRNLLIYFRTQLQDQVIPVFHYALRPGGFLFLGLSENVSRFTELFQPIDQQHRTFQRRGFMTRTTVPLAPFLPQLRNGRVPPGNRDGTPRHRAEVLRRFSAAILKSFAPVYVIIDEADQALLFSAGTGKYLQAPPGPPTRDVVAMARPGLRADLYAALRGARETGQRMTRERIPVEVDGEVRMVGLAVQPITEADMTAYGVVFTDQGPVRPPDESDGRGAEGDAVLRQIEQELQETRERLQATIEELETANEEFRSSNEELVSVNEELQSTNEELETSKEELQSVNEELQTVNAELSSKIEELGRANTDLNNFIQSTQIATVFLDRNLVIRNFTPEVTRIFNLIPSDRGRPLTDIVGRIDYPELESDMHAVAGTGQTIERSVGVEGGAHYLARILPYRNNDNVIDGVILTFVDVTSIIAAEEKQKALTGELNHRVKNTLAVVCSIVDRTLPSGEAKQTLLGRLYALAQTHDLLTNARWADLPLYDLIAAELAPHASAERGTLRIDGPPVMLKPRAALSLSLAIHELATNAAKYGALSVDSGRIDITWTIAGSNPARLRLVWTEQGGPEITRFSKRGFGTELIERSIPFELKGEATLEIVDKSVRCTLVIPENPEHFTFGSTARAAN
ncbi:MAG TPA: chemotaxis protein CheB [Stellaceae bacterium]|nr:chemotaxis protein CheB [Stellaceae bacterium]